MLRLACLAAVLLSCSADQRLIMHPNGIFEDTKTGECFVYQAAGIWADVRFIRCPP